MSSSSPDADPVTAIALASASDVGQVRTANEDSCEIFSREDGTRLLVVADGMGGARGGATASQAALAVIAEAFERGARSKAPAMLEEAVQGANTRVYEMAQADPELEGMGTTVVAFHLDAKLRGTVAHVGDSRAYRYRRGQLEPITTDHSVVAEMQKRGLLTPEEAAAHPRRNEILRAVGVLPAVEVEVTDVDVAPGDRFVLCSDGLSGVVADDEIAAVIQAQPPDIAVATLIEMANDRGGPDNITVQVLSIPADAKQGDPEATAPVEISAIGIEAIETRRRRRIRTQRITAALAVLALAAAGYFVWRFLNPPSSPPPRPRTPVAPITPPPAGGPGEAGDQFEIDRPPARRGVPRDPSQPTTR